MSLVKMSLVDYTVVDLIKNGLLKPCLKGLK